MVPDQAILAGTTAFYSFGPFAKRASAPILLHLIRQKTPLCGRNNAAIFA